MAAHSVEVVKNAVDLINLLSELLQRCFHKFCLDLSYHLRSKLLFGEPLKVVFVRD